MLPPGSGPARSREGAVAGAGGTVTGNGAHKLAISGAEEVLPGVWKGQSQQATSFVSDEEDQP